MDKRPVYDFLKRIGVWFEVTEHPAVYNMDEVHLLDLPYPDADAKICLSGRLKAINGLT